MALVQNNGINLGKYQVPLHTILQDPSTFLPLLWTVNYSPFNIDRGCLYQMGENNITDSSTRINYRPLISPIIRRLFRCQSCHRMNDQISSLSRRGSFKKQITSPDVRVVSTEGLPSDPQLSKIPNLYLRIHHQKIRPCDPSLNRLIGVNFFGSDSFTNQTLILLLLEDILTEHSMERHISQIYHLFICCNRGYYVQQLSMLGTVSTLHQHGTLLDPQYIRPDIIWEIIIKGFALLHLLKEYDFSWGSIDETAFLFSHEPIGYYHDGVWVQSEVILKLTNMEYAGLTIPRAKIRLYRRSAVVENRPDINTNPFSRIMNHVISPQETIMIYRLDSSSETIRQRLNYFGVPMYPSSLNAYFLMTILMADYSFYRVIVNSPSLYNLWISMWIPGDLESIDQHINQLHHTKTTDLDVISFLSNFRLRCDCTDFIWAKIKDMINDQLKSGSPFSS